MAASFNIFQAQKALFVSLAFFLLLLSRVSLAEKETVSFSFPGFVPDHQRILTLQGDHTGIELGIIKLTGFFSSSRGQALYSSPIHIWDKGSGNLASFDTSFSFVITPLSSSTRTADGLAFFLAPENTQPKKADGFLGLFENDEYNKSNQIVAVEFDTFYNAKWDPRGEHIGIDVNSIRSTKTTRWYFTGDRMVANVDISYKASSKSLNVSLYYPSISGKSFIVTDVVDLKDILPEWVRVGFSASTGTEVGLHDITSWSFHSELPISTSTEAFMNKAHLSGFVQRV